MKVSIIGGGGRVGACAAYALECQGLVSDIQIIDANADAAEGEALDLLHGAAVLGGQRIFTGCYKRAANSDIFIITAGLRRKPDESRLDLRELFMLAVATSIDALAVGLTFAMTNTNAFLPSCLIGVVCAAISACGLFLGKKLSSLPMLNGWAEVLGGVVLLGIGLNILHESGVI